MGHKYGSILETVGQYAGCQDQPPRAAGRQSLRQGRGLQSARFGQGPPRARRHRGGGEVDGALKPGQTVHRGDQRQHRHRPRHGLRRQGLSARPHHGRAVQRRAPQADALPRRQGGHHAGRRARGRHDHEDGGTGREARLVHDPPVRERSQSRLPFEDHGGRNPRRFLRRAARLLGHRLWHRRHAERRRTGPGQGAPRDQDHRLRTRRSAADRQRRAAGSAIPTGRRRRRIRPSSRIRCRAGRRISFRS